MKVPYIFLRAGLIWQNDIMSIEYRGEDSYLKAPSVNAAYNWLGNTHLRGNIFKVHKSDCNYTLGVL